MTGLLLLLHVLKKKDVFLPPVFFGGTRAFLSLFFCFSVSTTPKEPSKFLPSPHINSGKEKLTNLEI